jgi:hypothetical protein
MWKTRTFGLLTAAVLLTTGGSALAASSKNFGTHLKGDHERPVARDTHAQGQATFQVNEDGTAIHYKLNVANIENVTQAHIHRGPSDGTGPIVVWLYPEDGTTPAPPAAGRTQGRLAEGTITASDLVNTMAGQPLSALIAAIEAGDAYVNVHTDDGQAPPNSGPGDFPGGEVRGQLP